MESVEYQPILTDAGYYNNWWIEFDLVCESPQEVGSIVAIYFLGYVFGTFLFFLPNQIGRKPSTVISLLSFILANGAVVYATNITQIKIGFFIQGVMHLKNTLSYSYCTELMENTHKQLSMTLISLFDTFSLVITTMYLIYVDKDLVEFLRIWYIIGTTASIIFIIAIPESPRFLFMSDPSSKRAIGIMNYIAWFNGSDKRIPEDAVMDTLYQVIKDTNQLHQTD